MLRFMQLPVLPEYEDGFYLRTQMIAQLGYILFTVSCLLAIWECIQFMVQGGKLQKCFFAAALLFCGPMTFLLERGNILLLSLLFLLFFMALYDSEDKRLRYASYFCLSLAAAIKIYPAVFGLMVIKKKRYREAGILLGTGIVSFFLPFLPLGGYSAVSQWLHGVFSADRMASMQGYGYNYSVANLARLTFGRTGLNGILSPLLICAAGAVALIIFIASKEEWKQWFALVLICVWIPSFSYTYTLVLLFLPIISYFGKDRPKTRFDDEYLTLFVITMIPMTLPILQRTASHNLPLSWGHLLGNAALIGIAALILIEGVMNGSIKNSVQGKEQQECRAIEKLDIRHSLLRGKELAVLCAGDFFSMDRKDAHTNMQKDGENLKKRNSTIELVRIICMLLLVAHHCAIHGGAYAMQDCTNHRLALFFLPVGKICFDCFVAISAWYMVDTKFRSIRFVKMWLQVLFYNVVFMACTAVLGTGYAESIGLRHWVGAFFPITGNSHGFAAAYLAYCLLIPFLQFVVEQLNQTRAKLLIALLFCVQVFSSILGEFTGYFQPLPSEVLLFVLFYFTAFYLKHWHLEIQQNKPLLFLFVAGVWLIHYRAWITQFTNPGSVSQHIINLCSSESSLPNIIAGFALFLLVKDVKMPYIPWINRIATTTFGILLFHDHNYFRPVIWHRFVKAETWYYVPTVRFIAYYAAAVCGVFFAGMLIDFARQSLEVNVLRSRLTTSVCEKLNGIFQVKENEKTENEAQNSHE